ncbi:MAG: PepSY domain-containing protein [Pyrinomonadaceae bacterium]
MKKSTNLKIFAVLFLVGGTTVYAQTTPPSNQNKPQKSNQTKRGGENAETEVQEQLAKQAKIKLEDARETALKRAPGTVESGELERENKQLVYSFDIRNAQGAITEVQVSAITGEVVSVKQESAQQEAAEKKQEKNEKSGNSRSGEDSTDQAGETPFTVPQRPTVSNSAEFQRPGVLQLAYGYDSNFHQPGTPSQQFLPLALRFAVSSRILVEFDNTDFVTQTAPDDTRQSGIGDTNLGVQYVIHHQTKTSPGLAASYYIKIPTASSSKGLGTGRVDHIFTGLASKNVGSITIDFNAIYLLAGRQSRAGYASSGQFALAFSRGLTKNLGGTAEISGYSRSDNSPGAILGLVGFGYQVNQRFSVYSGVRFGLTSAAPRIGFLAGITVGIANLYKKKG